MFSMREIDESSRYPRDQESITVPMMAISLIKRDGRRSLGHHAPQIFFKANARRGFTTPYVKY